MTVYYFNARSIFIVSPGSSFLEARVGRRLRRIASRLGVPRNYIRNFKFSQWMMLVNKNFKKLQNFDSFVRTRACGSFFKILVSLKMKLSKIEKSRNTE